MISSIMFEHTINVMKKRMPAKHDQRQWCGSTVETLPNAKAYQFHSITTDERQRILTLQEA
jgi:hypothetical protein